MSAVANLSAPDELRRIAKLIRSRFGIRGPGPFLRAKAGAAQCVDMLEGRADRIERKAKKR